MGSKVIKQKLYEYQAILKHKECEIKEVLELLSTRAGQLKQLQEDLTSKKKRIEELRKNLEYQVQQFKVKWEKERIEMPSWS